MGDWDVVSQKNIGDWDVVNTDVAEMGGSLPVDTRTGQPVPTDAERLHQTRGVLRSAPGVAGDIAGTIGAQVASNYLLPGSGMLPTLGRFAARAAGAGLGGAAGELAGQQAFGEDTDFSKILEEGALSSGGEVALGAVGGALKKAYKPTLELVADLTITGSRTKKLLANRAKEVAEKKAERFIKSVAPEQVKKGMDEAGLKKALQSAYEENNALYNYFGSVLNDIAKKNGGAVPLVNTQMAMEAWLKEQVASGAYKTQAQAESAIIRQLGFSPGGTGANSQHVTIRKLLRGEDISPEYVEYLMKNVFPKKTKDWLSLEPDVKQLRETFKEMVMRDLDELGAAAGKKTGDDVFKELKRFEAVKRIYDQATVFSKETGELVKFNPYQFYETVMINERMFRQTMPELWPKLKAEAETMKKIAEKLKAGERGSGIAQFGGSGTVLALGNAGLIPWVEAAGTASALAIMTDTGQKILEGIFKFGLKPAAKTYIHNEPSLRLQQAH